MCEDMGLCTHFTPHKAKIYFFLCSMREYRDELVQAGFEVDYYQLAAKEHFFEMLLKSVKKRKIKKLSVFEIEDHFFEKKVIHFCKENDLDLEILSSPNFICSREDFATYLKKSKRPFMKTFYEEQRASLNILMDNGAPTGGKFSFDTDNRKKIPKKEAVPDYKPKKYQSPHQKEIEALIDKYFSNHPGDIEEFCFPTNRKDAEKHLKEFLKNRIDKFGDYEDALDDRNPFLYHSLLSPLMNIGFLAPIDCVRQVEKALTETNLNSVEGFIRQVMGWREFIRGIYHHFDHEQQKRNFFEHKRKLNKCWWTGETGIPVVDKVIRKALRYGYCHHIERLMVISNLMLILEVDPKEVHRWFMEMFIDSLDWVMGPNVYGMGQFSDGGIFATKPYFSGSNYILKMSHEKKGEWCDGWDGLYWLFIKNNKEFFKKNYRMSMMVKMLEKMDKDKQKRIFKAARSLQDQLTLQ